MKNTRASIAIVFTMAFAFAGCQSSPTTTPTNTGPGAKNFKYGTGDGQTMTTAVEIRTRSETDGGVMIRNWIKQRYPGYTIQQQELIEQRDRAYNMITIIGPSNTPQNVFFDITSYYRRIGNETFPRPVGLTRDVFDIREDDVEMILRLLAALGAGALIGYERSFHGRPAGLRTHVLVCLASSLLMLVTVYEDHWVRSQGEARLDPTRMAQGIMTGIGFLGAGVIVKEGLNVRGLTTAASIWITAAIGVLAGVGLYLPLVVSVILTLSVLSVFRWIEMRVPTQAYYNFDVKYENDGNLTEDEMRGLIQQHKFSIANFSYRLDAEGRVLRHSMTLQTTDRGAASRLANTLKGNSTVLEFRISPTGD